MKTKIFPMSSANTFDGKALSELKWACIPPQTLHLTLWNIHRFHCRLLECLIIGASLQPPGAFMQYMVFRLCYLFKIETILNSKTHLTFSKGITDLKHLAMHSLHCFLLTWFTVGPRFVVLNLLVVLISDMTFWFMLKFTVIERAKWECLHFWFLLCT